MLMGQARDADANSKLIEVKTRIPERTVQFITQLVARGYYSSIADFARKAILDKLINDFELGISELEPDIFASWRGEKERKIEKEVRKGGKLA
jgi:Arc/MetJ-type ribon-helix-helix transcriptional regulator